MEQLRKAESPHTSALALKRLPGSMRGVGLS